MCVYCDGQSWEEVHAHQKECIQAYGYTMVGVEADEHGHGWMYTIGLTERASHPELVVAISDVGLASAVLVDMATRVVLGEHFDQVDENQWFEVMGGEVKVVPVNQVHLRHGLMAAWIGYYEGEGRTHLVLSALQVILPDDGYCAQHQKTQPRLDRGALSPLVRPRPATRRALARGHRRSS